MAKKPEQAGAVQDEPGAAERFDKIVGRVLHTPAKHKTGKSGKPASPAATKKGKT